MGKRVAGREERAVPLVKLHQWLWQELRTDDAEKAARAVPRIEHGAGKRGDCNNKRIGAHMHARRHGPRAARIEETRQRDRARRTRTGAGPRP
jgi:hypothetical protein